MYNKILLASDGSEHSLRAANHAIELAKCNPDSKVVVAYVVDHAKAKSEVLETWNSLGVMEKRKEKMVKTEEQAKEAGINYEIKMLRGEPGPALVAYVNDQNFDIVVVGSRGLNGLQEMVLGSVSHKIAKRAHCPVLIVK